MRKWKRWGFSVGFGILISGLYGVLAIGAQGPDRWKDDVRQFEAADAASSPPENAIVFTGSSSIVFWNTIHRDMAPLTVINRGFGGSTLDDLIYWLDPVVLKYKPRAVVVYEGDNDIGERKLPPKQVLERFKALFSRIHARLPQARIYILSIKPSILRWAMWPEMERANSLLRAFCETERNVRYIDVATLMLDAQGRPRADLFEADGLHMNTHGYDLWVSVLKPRLLEDEQSYDHRDENASASVPPETGTL